MIASRFSFSSGGSNANCISRSNLATRSSRAGISSFAISARSATSEFFHAPGGIDKFLFAGEKRMAGGTDADSNVSFGRASVINRAARANDVGLLIIGMNVRLHIQKRANNLAAEGQIRK